jgi:CcmD family protein
MDTRNFAFLCYGLVAAWLILCAYVVTLAARERKLKRELERLRLLVENQERS